MGRPALRPSSHRRIDHRLLVGTCLGRSVSEDLPQKICLRRPASEDLSQQDLSQKEYANQSVSAVSSAKVCCWPRTPSSWFLRTFHRFHSQTPRGPVSHPATGTSTTPSGNPGIHRRRCCRESPHGNSPAGPEHHCDWAPIESPSPSGCCWASTISRPSRPTTAARCACTTPGCTAMA